MFENFLPTCPRNFTGRTEDLRLFTESFATFNIFFLQGDAGVGKTVFLVKLLKENCSGTTIFYQKIRAGESLLMTLNSLFSTSFEEPSALFRYLGENFQQQDKILFLDDLHLLQFSELELLMTYFCQYYSGKGKIFFAGRTLALRNLFVDFSNLMVHTLKNLSEREAINFIKSLSENKNYSKSDTDKIISLSQGNPFYLKQLSLLDTLTESFSSKVYTTIFFKLTENLSEEEIEFIKFYSVLDFALELKFFNNNEKYKILLNNLLFKKIIELQGNNFCQLNDLLKVSVNHTMNKSEKKNFALKALSFLKSFEKTPLNSLLLAKLNLENDDFEEGASLIEENINQWLALDLNIDEIIQLVEKIIQTGNKKLLTKKIINNLLVSFLRKDRYADIIKIVREVEKEKCFNPLFYWFRGTACLEIGNFEEAEKNAKALLSLEKNYCLRGKILLGRIKLRVLAYEEAENIFESLLNASGNSLAEYPQEAKFLYISLAQLYEEKNNFKKALLFLEKARDIGELPGKDNHYNRLLYRINKLSLTLSLGNLEPTVYKEAEQLESEVATYFYYNFSAIFTLLKVQILIKEGKLKLAGTYITAFQKKLKGSSEALPKEVYSVLLCQAELFLFCDQEKNFEISLKSLLSSKFPYIRKKAESLKKISLYLKNGVFTNNFDHFSDYAYFLADQPVSDLLLKTQLLGKKSKANPEKMLDSLIEELDKNHTFDFSIEGVHLANLALLTALKMQETKKARFAMNIFTDQIDKLDLSVPKWVILKKLYSIVILEDYKLFKELKSSLFNEETPAFLKHLLLHIFQAMPEEILPDLLSKYNYLHLKISGYQKQLFDFYLSSFQFNIREDFLLREGKKSKPVTFFELVEKLISKRGLILDEISGTVFSSAGKILLTKSKQLYLYEMLLLLLEEQGRMVEKEEFIIKIWNKNFIPESDDFIVYNNIKRLRDFLLDEDKEIIQVSKQSYFIPEKILFYSIKKLTY